MVGEVDESLRIYTESIDSLAARATDDEEIHHALSVTLNKKGDVLLALGKVAEAVPLYRQSWDIRRALLQSADTTARVCSPVPSFCSSLGFSL